MAKIDVYNLKGETLDKVNLNDDIFGVKLNQDLMHQAIKIYLSNARQTIAHVRSRGEVAGSGRRPWKQKGTGRARVGDSRTSNWIGGGKALGPRKEKNYSRKFAKNMRKKSIFMALSDKLNSKRLLIIDDLKINKISTKSAITALSNLPIKEGKLLLIIDKADKNILLSFRNIPYIKLITADSINVYDLSNADWLIVTDPAIKRIEEVFLNKSIIKTPEVIKPIKKVTKIKATKKIAKSEKK
jgi:large subunit ribosomal protein L4